MAGFDAPAFVRRARDVHSAWEAILQRCAHQRNEWLQLPKTRLGMLLALAGSWSAIGELLAAPADAEYLQWLGELWKPKLRVRVEATPSRAKRMAALQEFVESSRRFNRRWERFIEELALTGINEQRADYNQFYLLEKECALRSAALARQGFQPLPMVTTDDLYREFPLLCVPEFRLH